MDRWDSWKVVAVDEHNDLVAEYIFAIKEDAVLFYEDMTNKGYECVCFRVNV